MWKDRADPATFIIKDILKCNPKCSADDVQSIVEISRKYAGADGSFAEPFKEFVGTFKVPGRTVFSNTLKAMADLKLSPT